MITLTSKGTILLKYQQKVLTKNKKYNYKEVTIPSDIYQLWTQQAGTEPKTVTLLTIIPNEEHETQHKNFLVLKDHVTKEDVNTISGNKNTISGNNNWNKYSQQQLTVRINRNKKSQKQKATMSLNKGVNIMAAELVFIVDPNMQCLTGQFGVTSVEGLSCK